MSFVGGRVFANFIEQLGLGGENFAADSYKVALFTSSYAPNLDTDCAYQVNAPAAPTLTQASGGALAARTEYYNITFVNPVGESSPSAEASISADASKLVSVTAPANPGGSCTGYNVYASTTSGAEQKQNATPIAFGTNWTEPSSGLATGGASPPSANTAAISGEVAAGNGYTNGGAALSSTEWATTTANNWADIWASSTNYVLGQIVRPPTSNGYLYLCVQAGASGASAPTWGTTIDALTTDGTVQWLCLNTSLVTFSAANVSWTVTDTIIFRYIVVYNSTTKNLVALFDPGANQNSANSGQIQSNWDSASIVAI